MKAPKWPALTNSHWGVPSNLHLWEPKRQNQAKQIQWGTVRFFIKSTQRRKTPQSHSKHCETSIWNCSGNTHFTTVSFPQEKHMQVREDCIASNDATILFASCAPSFLTLLSSSGTHHRLFVIARSVTVSRSVQNVSPSAEAFYSTYVSWDFNNNNNFFNCVHTKCDFVQFSSLHFHQCSSRNICSSWTM